MRWTAAILIPLFFVSGATALAYQVVWLRELQYVFGTSTLAVSTLLAVFMLGLAAGGFAIARAADRSKRPLVLYGLVEIGVGLYALVFPALLSAATPVYLGIWRALEPGPLAFGLVQFSIVTVLLLLPTAAMGATLPLLGRFSTRRLSSAGRRIGTLYSANTLGAVAGAGLCGFVLLPDLGISATTKLAAAANCLLGVAALVLAWRTETPGRGAVHDLPLASAPPAVIRAVRAAVSLAGASALIYEVAWTRLLGLILGSSAYTFSVVLIAFLGGIALGGKLGGPLSDRVLKANGRSGVLLGFAAIEIGIAALAYGTMYLYPELPFWYVGLFDEFQVQQRPEAAWYVSLLLAAVVMALPALLMGMHFPFAVRAVIDDGERIGRPVGAIYGFNAIGAALGAFLGGFVLLPALDLRGTVTAAASVGLAAAGLLVLVGIPGPRRRWVAVLPVALLGLALPFAMRPPWNPLMMTAGLYQYVPTLADHSRPGIRSYSVDLFDLVFYEEGLSSVVTVADNIGSSHRWIAVNGKVDASTTDDMPTQVLLALLPMQFVEQPEDVLVIGLASGITAGSASLLPAVERLRIVELEPSMARAARYFDRWNHSVLSDPRAELVHNDGRNHLLLSQPESFDVVISEPSNPWISGVANLFTREFLELGKSRLAPGGVWSQWIPAYGLDDRDLQSILKTFAEVYPHVLVYATAGYSDLVLIGSETPLQPSEEAARRLFDHPAIARELRGVMVTSPLDLVSLFLTSRREIAGMDEGVPLNTDDNMFIEYSAAGKLYTDTRIETHAFLAEHARLPEAAFGGDSRKWSRLALNYRRRGDVSRSEAAQEIARELASRRQETLSR